MCPLSDGESSTVGKPPSLIYDYKMTTALLWIGNTPTPSENTRTVLAVYDNQAVGTVHIATPSHIEQAITRGKAAESRVANLPNHRRSTCLKSIAHHLATRRQDLALALTHETGKTLAESNAEIDRAIDTFTIASELCLHQTGDNLPMDRTSRGDHTWGITKRFPIGLVTLISPFNFPLNLAAHKIAPAIAAGNPFILKPASATPLSAGILGEILSQSGLPDGAFSIVFADRKTAEPLITDDRIQLISFTGSADVGWAIKSRCGKKQVVLELGGNASVIVEDAPDLEHVVNRIAWGAYYQAGQSCISVQHIWVRDVLADDVINGLKRRLRDMQVGNPLNPNTDIGPIISSQSKDRVLSWVAEALRLGAVAHTPIHATGSCINPILLEHVDSNALISTEEAFGPVAIVHRYSTFDVALSAINRSKYGLQTGLFVSDYQKIMHAFDTLVVGAVIVGDVPSYRLDHMPYGGRKDSGLGREGIADALLHMTEQKLLVLKRTN